MQWKLTAEALTFRLFYTSWLQSRTVVLIFSHSVFYNLHLVLSVIFAQIGGYEQIRQAKQKMENKKIPVPQEDNKLTGWTGDWGKEGDIVSRERGSTRDWRDWWAQRTHPLIWNRFWLEKITWEDQSCLCQHNDPKLNYCCCVCRVNELEYKYFFGSFVQRCLKGLIKIPWQLLGHADIQRPLDTHTHISHFLLIWSQYTPFIFNQSTCERLGHDS